MILIFFYKVKIKAKISWIDPCAKRVHGAVHSKDATSFRLNPRKLHRKKATPQKGYTPKTVLYDMD